MRKWVRGELVIALGLCAVVSPDPAWSLASFQQQLIASSADAQRRSGWSVAVDGDTAVVAAPFHRFQGDETGAAWVFTRVPGTTTWTQQAELSPADRQLGDAFGWSVAVSGDTVAVGAPWRACGTGTGCGGVYSFERNGGQWSEAGMLVGMAGSYVPDAWFGGSVAMREHYMIVGSPYCPPVATGCADVFRRGVNFSWQHEAHLAAANAAQRKAAGLVYRDRLFQRSQPRSGGGRRPVHGGGVGV